MKKSSTLHSPIKSNSQSKSQLRAHSRTPPRSHSQSAQQQPLLSIQYQTVLKGLLRLNSLASFVKQSSRYVYLSEEAAKKYLSHDEEGCRSRRQIPEIGRMLLADGEFLSHYCKLIEREESEIVGSPEPTIIRRHFAQKYRGAVQVRKQIFELYFRKEIQEMQLMIIKGTYSKKTKKNPGTPLNPFSTSISKRQQNKNRVISSKKDKNIENERKQSCNKAICVVECYQEEQQTAGFYRMTRLNANKKKETESQRQARFEGLISDNSARSNIPKRNQVKFEDLLRKDKGLRQYYQKALRQKQQLEKFQKLKKKDADADLMTPVKRTSLLAILNKNKRPRLKQLNEISMENILRQQRQIIAKYPSIYLIGSKFAVKLSETQLILGIYGNYFLKVVIVTIYPQTGLLYKAIYLQKIQKIQQIQTIEQCKFENDPSIEVFLTLND